MRNLWESIFNDDSILSRADKEYEFQYASKKIKDIWGDKFVLSRKGDELILKDRLGVTPSSTGDDDLSDVHIDKFLFLVINKNSKNVTFPKISNVSCLFISDENKSLFNLINNNVNNIYSVLCLAKFLDAFDYFDKVHIKYVFMTNTFSILKIKNTSNIEYVLYTILEENSRALYDFLKSGKSDKISKDYSNNDYIYPIYDSLRRIINNSSIPVAVRVDNHIYKVRMRGQTMYFDYMEEYNTGIE